MLSFIAPRITMRLPHLRPSFLSTGALRATRKAQDEPEIQQLKWKVNRNSQTIRALREENGQLRAWNEKLRSYISSPTPSPSLNELCAEESELKSYMQVHRAQKKWQRRQRLATEAVVEAGVALLLKEGSLAFPKLRQNPSEFYHDDTYLFLYDLESNVLFNAASPEKEGHNTLGLPDSNGKLFHDELIAVASTPERCGWVDYMWPKPGETEPSGKRTYSKAVTVDGKEGVLMSGFYM